MRKLPRRLPSNSPSLAWVAFAVLALTVLGGIGALYAHRQNQETTRRQQVADLTRELDTLREKNAALMDEFNARVLAPTLQMAVKEKRLPLVRIPADRLRHATAREARAGVRKPPDSAAIARNP
jgi:hypothetical protein